MPLKSDSSQLLPPTPPTTLLCCPQLLPVYLNKYFKGKGGEQSCQAKCNFDWTRYNSSASATAECDTFLEPYWKPETGSTYCHCSSCQCWMWQQFPYMCPFLAYHHVAPATGESRDAVVSLDALAALAAASIAVALHPVVQQIRAALWFLRLDIGVDAGGRCMLHATLVHRVLANCKRMRC